MTSDHEGRWNKIKEAFRRYTFNVYVKKKRKIPPNLQRRAEHWGNVLSNPDSENKSKSHSCLPHPLSDPEIENKMKSHSCLPHPLSKDLLLPHMSIDTLGNSEERMQRKINDYLHSSNKGSDQGIMCHLKRLECFETVSDLVWLDIKDFIIIKIKIKWLVLLKRHNPKNDGWTVINHTIEDESVGNCRIT